MKKKLTKQSQKLLKTASTKRKERNSSIELLRIIAMLMIVFHHLSYHTPWQNLERGTFEWYWITILKSFGKVGVAIFFIITGFFMQQKSPTKESARRKTISVYRKTLFYSLLGFIFAISTGVLDLSKISFPFKQEFVNTFIPFFGDKYWFITDYIILELFSPYLARMLKKLKRKEIRNILIAYMIFSFGSKMINFTTSSSFSVIFSVPVSLFYVVIGYYLGKRKKVMRRNLKKNLILLIPFIIILILSPLFFNFLTNFKYKYGGDMIWAQDSVVCALISISLFCIFATWNLKNKFINYIASLMFGVYLIHDNNYVRKWIWALNPFYNVQNLIHERKIILIIFSLLIPMIVFIISTIIDGIRAFLAKRISAIFKKLKAKD